MPLGKGPLAECDYWKERETGLLMLVEQLKAPIAKRILTLLNNVLSPFSSNFDYFYSDLWKYYSEARDNNRFLQTLLRHFKVRTRSVETSVENRLERKRVSVSDSLERNVTVDNGVGLLQNDQPSHYSADGGNKDDLDPLELLLQRGKNGRSDGKDFLAALPNRHQTFVHRRSLQVSSFQ